MTDIDCDVDGILSATMNMKTVIVSSTEIPNVIFSPLSGGNNNLLHFCVPKKIYSRNVSCRLNYITMFILE
jgi:hypothetical protein